MPRSWKEDKIFRDKVRSGKINWEHLLSRPNNRKPKSKRDHYYVANGKSSTSNGYRLIWILSKQKAQQDVELRDRNIEKALDNLRELQTRLNTYNLKTRENIDKKIISMLKESRCTDFIDYEILSNIEYKIHHKKAGRPKRNGIGKSVPNEYFTIYFQTNEDSIGKESLTDGVFPLITNLKDHTPKEVLEIYKYQPFIEKRNSQLKKYQEIAPAFLKKPQRVISYLHMNVMALMVATLIERQLRRAMKLNSIKSIPIYPEERACKGPTAFDIVRLFKGIERFEVEEGDKVCIFPAQLNDSQRQVLKLLDVPISLYQ